MSVAVSKWAVDLHRVTASTGEVYAVGLPRRPANERDEPSDEPDSSAPQ